MVNVGDAVAPGYYVSLERASVAAARVVEYAVAHLVGKVHTLAVVLEYVHHSQRLLVVAKVREITERTFARVSVRRVAEVVTERDRFGKVLVEPKRARNRAGNLADFQRMRKPRTVMVAFGGKKNLRFVFKSTKRLAMDYSVAVALILGAHRAFLDGNPAPAGFFALRRVRRKVPLFYLVSGRFIIAFFGQNNHPLDITSKFSFLQVFSRRIGQESFVFR